MGVGQERMEKYLGSGQGPNRAVQPLVTVVKSKWLRIVNEVVLTCFGILCGIRLKIMRKTMNISVLTAGTRTDHLENTSVTMLPLFVIHINHLEIMHF
jgi:hypothetical protein